MPQFEVELSEALAAAQKAGDLIRRDYESFVAIADAPVDISTATDRGAQEIILQHLQQKFPGDSLCAEENTDTLRNSQQSGNRVWVVDPIDGTRGFAMKNGEFSVMIGLLIDGELAVGVVLEPVFDRFTYATRGGGCWTRTGTGHAQLCKVSLEANPKNSVLVQSHSRSPDQRSAPVQAIVPARVIEVYSAGVKLALVARGEADLYVNIYPNFHDWDIAAGHLLVTEAGGRVTTLRNEPVKYGAAKFEQKGGLLATNSAIHDAATQLLAGLGA